MWWFARRPARMTAVLGSVLAGYWRSPRRLGRSLLTCAAGAAHARSMRPLGIDHVHAHFATYPALAAWVGSRLLDVPYSFTAHAHDIYVDRLNLGTLVRDAKAVAVISEFNEALLIPYARGGATPIR